MAREDKASKSGVKTQEVHTEKVAVSPLNTLLSSTDVLLMLFPKNEYGTFSTDIASHDEITVYNLVQSRKGSKDSLIILLDTGGGNVYSAVKMMDTFRTKYKTVTIAIPQEAKSSGTMMCLGANKLIMSSIAELGPLDKPLPHPDNENSYISALDIVKSIEGTLDIAIEKQNKLTDRYISKGIKTTKGIELASDFISRLISPMLSHEDMKIYNQAKRLLTIADNYGTELLSKYMLGYLKNAKVRDRFIEAVIRQFIWLYPDHAFAIRRDELREWLFNVDNAEDLDYWKELWQEFERNRTRKTLKYLEVDPDRNT